MIKQVLTVVLAACFISSMSLVSFARDIGGESASPNVTVSSRHIEEYFKGFVRNMAISNAKDYRVVSSDDFL